MYKNNLSQSLGIFSEGRTCSEKTSLFSEQVAGGCGGVVSQGGTWRIGRRERLGLTEEKPLQEAAKRLFPAGRGGRRECAMGLKHIEIP